MSRTVPTIDICGDTFFVYIKMNEIRKIDPPYCGIYFNQMQPVCDDLKYRFWYNTKDKCLYQITSNTRKIPDHVVCIEIPYELKLDPIGVAEKFGINDPAFLEKFKSQQNITATIIPLKETGILHILSANRKNRTVQSLFNKGKKL